MIIIDSLSSVSSFRSALRASIASKAAQSKSLRAEINAKRSDSGSGPERHRIELERRALGSQTRLLLLMLAMLRGRTRASLEPVAREKRLWSHFGMHEIGRLRYPTKGPDFSVYHDAMRAAERVWYEWLEAKRPTLDAESMEAFMEVLRELAKFFPEKKAEVAA